MFDFDPADWPQTPQVATDLQKAWRSRVRLADETGNVDVIAGVDVAYDPATDRAFAVALLLDAARLTPIAHCTAWRPAAFPYVPGLLSFREIPAVMAALAQLPRKPDLLMVDGQGVAHPRRFGIAAHLGVLTDLPAIGVAKSRLCGHHASLPPEKGATAPLIDRGEVIGTVLRSKAGCNPLYISAGHRIDQAMALAWTLRCLKTYRLPEPTRLADKLSKQKDDRLFALSG